jgi:hypothetical protein
LQDAVAVALTHSSTAVGLLPVPVAPKRRRQIRFWRCRQVLAPPYRWLVPLNTQSSSFVQLAVAESVHAWSAPTDIVQPSKALLTAVISSLMVT